MVEGVVRAFVAIELPEEFLRGLGHILARLRERVPGPDVKWVAAGSIHVTLKFLGEMPASGVEEVRHVLEGTCTLAEPMELGVTTLGAFPSLRVPAVIWVGLKGDLLPLASLARRIDAALIPLGFPQERRPFTPHLTLARVRQEASSNTKATIGNAIVTTSVTEELAFEAAAASLMKSQLTPRGALYSRLALLPFGPTHVC